MHRGGGARHQRARVADDIAGEPMRRTRGLSRIAAGKPRRRSHQLYRAEVEESRRVSGNAPSLDDLSAKGTLHRGQVTLRWIMVHMLEETARHAGHLDLMRENIDGKVGD